MPETLLAAFQIEGLIWLIAVVLVAGLVRGFSGFGSALIIMPVASSVLAPIEAIIFLTAVELLGPLPNLPAAWRDGAPGEIGLMLFGALLALPLGLWCLTLLHPVLFGWLVSVVVLILLALVMAGWRYRGALTRPLVMGTGGLGGFLTGFIGIPGPPVIMLYMASTQAISVIRANFLLYLLGIDLLLFLLLIGAGVMAWPIFVLGLCVALPYVVVNMIGARLFNPEAARLFRTVAYVVIAASAIVGLPVWKG
ncbi:MAG: TSUP family transporter [Sulfitobacter sp.]|nr:TSUP family transporter [Sulfitobacter sp.]